MESFVDAILQAALCFEHGVLACSSDVRLVFPNPSPAMSTSTTDSETHAHRSPSAGDKASRAGKTSASGTSTHGAAGTLPQEGTWGQVSGWLNLSGLDSIDPENVRNSTAFKLGALAGVLPALSVMSLTKFLTPDQVAAMDTGATSDSLWSVVAVLFSSALVGGAVAFFWAENRLRTIFSYGVAGPTIVLSMFLSGAGNLATKKTIESVEKKNEERLEEAKKEIQEAANTHFADELQKVVSTTNTDMRSNPMASTPAEVSTASNPDLAVP